MACPSQRVATLPCLWITAVAAALCWTLLHPRVEGATTETERDNARPQFWAFEPPQPHPLPAVGQRNWPRRRIDHFVLMRLEDAGLTPAKPADRRTWIRRVSFDLIGLPPTPQQVRTFLADKAPDAHARLVERLLSSPHYGERWARMWLDVARYAEDQAHIVGGNRSLCYPNAYLYRDWIIAALNDDLPYDDFLCMQLAADLIAPEQQADHAALGFIGLGPKYYRRGDLAVMADEWEDRVDTVARGLLGLTVACARCHDHKFDPISSEDYYALAGVFASTQMFNRPLSEGSERGKNGEAKSPDDAMHIVREAKPQDLPVFVRGDVNAKGPIVQRRFLAALSPGEPVTFHSGSGRLELARTVTSRDNPLTARVIVNRVWALHFGRPLVATPSNFGHLGDRPSHPQLLDDLAVRFMRRGWSLKWLQREILLSATYRQSSQASDATRTADPDNLLLGRTARRRLSVEAWRDAVLAVCGRLESTLGGKSIEPEDPEQRRRTVYSEVSRLELNRMLVTFDFPDPNAHAAQRSETTTPLQKLFVLNSPFMIAQADALAQRLLTADALQKTHDRIHHVYELLLSRPPTAAELVLGVEFVEADAEATEDRWRQYAQVLLASNEMLILD